jgi:hypothetical protein
MSGKQLTTHAQESGKRQSEVAADALALYFRETKMEKTEGDLCKGT